MKHVVVIAALDTKGDEARLIRDQVAGRGHRPVMVDVGVLADPAAPADVPARAVAEAGGGPPPHPRRGPRQRPPPRGGERAAPGAGGRAPGPRARPPGAAPP